MNFKQIFLSMIICFTTQIQCIQEQQTLLSRGNELFLQEHYQDAFNVYQRITDKDFVVMYNMALCCLRQNKKSEAVLFSKRAEKQAKSYKEFSLIEEILKLDEDKESAAPGWYEQLAIFCKKVILTSSILLMQIIVFIGLIFLMICWYTRWYIKHKKLSLFFLILWLFFYWIYLYKIDFIQQKYGVIIEKTIPVFAGPDASFYKKADLDESQLVAIIGQRDQYYKIKSDKLVGWIDSHHIELV